MLCKHESKEFRTFLRDAAKNLSAASKTDDPMLWEAVMINTLNCLPSWLERLQEEKE